MSRRTSCDYPVRIGKGAWDTCDKPAVWETDDLAEIHNLCADHCAEAMQMNDFRADRKAS